MLNGSTMRLIERARISHLVRVTRDFNRVPRVTVNRHNRRVRVGLQSGYLFRFHLKCRQLRRGKGHTRRSRLFRVTGLGFATNWIGHQRGRPLHVGRPDHARNVNERAIGTSFFGPFKMVTRVISVTFRSDHPGLGNFRFGFNLMKNNVGVAVDLLPRD